MPGVEGKPSVTEILEAVGLGYTNFLPKDRRDYYLKRGRALHAAIELDAAGKLDEASVHPDIAGRLRAYREFVVQTQHEMLHSEVELIHSRWGFCGHIDRIGMSRRRRQMIDWKSSVDEGAVALQLAGYDILWRDKYPDQPIDDFIALKLNEDGTFKAYSVDPRPYWQIFLASLVVVRHRAQRVKKAEAVPL